MSTLHTVNKSPFATNALLSCINHCLDGDAILMIEDGVYGALSGSVVSQAVTAKVGSVTVYVLEEDSAARGIAKDKMLSEVKMVSYEGFVDLVSTHDRTQAWL